MKYAIYTIIMLILSTAVLAQSPFEANQSSVDTTVEIAVATAGNMSSDIYQFANGDISTDLYCNGKSCSTNIFGGSIIMPENQTQYYTIYNNQQITEVRSGGGISFSSIISQLGSSFNSYFGGKDPHNDGYTLWSLLDYAFVSHQESQTLYNNVDYLALEIDRLSAENRMLRAYFNITLDKRVLECQAALETAKRTGQVITTEHGMIAEPNSLDHSCLTIKTVVSKPTQNTTPGPVFRQMNISDIPSIGSPINKATNNGTV